MSDDPRLGLSAGGKPQMLTAKHSHRSAPVALMLAPWLALAVAASVVVVSGPSGHYGLLLAGAPFIAAAVYSPKGTAVIGAVSVALYSGFRILSLTQGSTDVFWIKCALIVAATGSAVLVSQARLRERTLHRSRDIASVLQRELLPAETGGTSTVDVSHRYMPTDTDAGVGGDWFDVIPLSGGRVALAMGDVVGHGIEAASLMGRMRIAVQTLGELDLAPDELLAQMDVAAVRHAAQDDTCALAASCLYLIYDPIARECTLASAGHPPPALRHPDGTVEFLHLPQHPPLGMGDTVFEPITFKLAEDSVIALYTDGLLDLRHHLMEDALAPLAAALSHDVDSLDRLCQYVCDHALRDPTDDAALLLARVRSLPEQRVATWTLREAPEEIRLARKAVAHQLDTWNLSDMTFATELIVTELATNALMHASAPVTVRLIKDASLICEISDASHTPPHQRHARLLDDDGRGLVMVAQLASRWGTRYTDSGKTVWAEQDLT